MKVVAHRCSWIIGTIIILVKREPGENPGRCSHCVRELQVTDPPGNREGIRSVEQSQETCLSVEYQICCTRIDFLTIVRDFTVRNRYLLFGNVFN